jgi:hypothetical protein
MTTIKYTEYLGVNVCKEVLELMHEIKKKNPMLSFTVGSNRTTFFDDATPPNRIEVKTSLLAHDVNDPSKPIGVIGYDTDEKYWVRSRLIQNEKYGRWNTSQHQSKFSKHMKNIVKESVKSLKPLSYEEVREENEGHVLRAIDQRSRQVIQQCNAYMKMDFSKVFPELLHMHNIGYTPKGTEFAQAITYAVENKEELEKYYDYKPKKCMVWVRPNSVVYEIDKEIKQVNSVQELPEYLHQKIFVLDITDKGQFVEDVGIKQDTGIYWVLL